MFPCIVLDGLHTCKCLHTSEPILWGWNVVVSGQSQSHCPGMGDIHQPMEADFPESSWISSRRWLKMGQAIAGEERPRMLQALLSPVTEVERGSQVYVYQFKGSGEHVQSWWRSGKKTINQGERKACGKGGSWANLIKYINNYWVTWMRYNPLNELQAPQESKLPNIFFIHHNFHKLTHKTLHSFEVLNTRYKKYNRGAHLYHSSQKTTLLLTGHHGDSKSVKQSVDSYTNQCSIQDC